jgi:hypothetical protein
MRFLFPFQPQLVHSNDGRCPLVHPVGPIDAPASPQAVGSFTPAIADSPCPHFDFLRRGVNGLRSTHAHDVPPPATPLEEKPVGYALPRIISGLPRIERFKDKFQPIRSTTPATDVF